MLLVTSNIIEHPMISARRKKTLDDEVAELGLRRTTAALPAMAQVVSEAAARGEINADDVNAIFDRYYTAGGKFKQTDGKTTPSFRVQSSKLRQIVKAKDPELLRQVTSIYGQHESGERRALYEVMVEASRWLLTRGARPSARKIKEFVKKNW